MNTTDDILRIVNENSDYVKIAEYIIEYLPDVFEFLEAKEVAKYLVNEFEYTKADILMGKANDDIVRIARIKLIRDNSVQKDSSKKEKVPLKTKKKSISKKVIAISLALAFGLSGIMYISHGIEDGKEDQEISQMLGMLVKSENERGSIVSQNTYGIYQGGDRKIAYNVDGIANDIIKVCVQTPELLDLAIYRTYFDMNYNRLENMDDVIRWIKILASGQDDLSFVTEKLEGINTFLDYALKNTISSEEKDYQEYKRAIEIYNALSENNDYAYNILPKETQKIIDNLISKFEESRDHLYAEYKDDLESLIGDQDPEGRNGDQNPGGRK